MFTLSNFYKSDEWINLCNSLMLERVNSEGAIICEHCGKPIVAKYDCIRHHIIELTNANVNDYNISLNPTNIMLVHHKCHNKIHERFGYEKPQKVYIVYGSPCSGKSTWVNDIASKDDLILDIDKIWECISVNSREYKSNRLKTNVFGIRDCILDQVKCRVGKWKNAYIIGGYPLATDRDRLSNLLGAELIYIECDKEVCLDRCINDEWKDYVNEWWSMYTPPIS